MRFLTAGDVFDIALTENVRIVKRHVYSRPAVRLIAEYMRVIDARKQRKLNWKYEGRLAKGTSSNDARGEAFKAYVK